MKDIFYVNLWWFSCYFCSDVLGIIQKLRNIKHLNINIIIGLQCVDIQTFYVIFE